jgi:hypothetical protein
MFFHFLMQATVKSDAGLPGQLARDGGNFNRPVAAINFREKRGKPSKGWPLPGKTVPDQAALP